MTDQERYDTLRRGVEALFYRVSREGPNWVALELGYLLPVYPNPHKQHDDAVIKTEELKWIGLTRWKVVE